MQRPSRLLPIALALTLAACGDSAPEFSPLDAPKTNRVSVVQQEHVVRFSHGRADLEPGEQARLSEFLSLQGGQANGGATIAVGPSTGPSGIVAGRERILRDALTRRGYRQIDAIHTGSDTGGANQVVIAVNRYVVTTPRCPDYSKPSESNYTNTTHSNFGCANAHNLGVMVADPADLVRGRPTGAQDGTQAVLGIQRYRVGKTTPLIKDDTGSEAGGKQ
jgi:pilus assembly protein CpaD